MIKYHILLLSIGLVLFLLISGCTGDQANGINTRGGNRSEGADTKISAAIPVRVAVVTKGDIAIAGSLQALRTLRDEYINLDTVRVQGYMATSLAGQVSDLAEGARLMDGTAAIERAQEQILDKIEYLIFV